MKKYVSILTIMFLFILVLASISVYSESLSEGLLALPEQETVFADHEGMWKYSLHIYNTEDEEVSIKEIIMEAYTFKGDYVSGKIHTADQIKDWWGSNKISPEQTKQLSGGLPNKNKIYFIDFIAYGKDANGDDVKGACRIYFVKNQEQKDFGPF